jgi:hypothetical protein
MLVNISCATDHIPNNTSETGPNCNIFQRRSRSFVPATLFTKRLYSSSIILSFFVINVITLSKSLSKSGCKRSEQMAHECDIL